MADLAALRRLALALPEVADASEGDRLAFEVAGRGIAWSSLKRTAPEGSHLVQPLEIAIRCAPERKAMLIEASPDCFFDDGQDEGCPAVLVRLDAIAENELAHLLYQAWRLQAPRTIQARHTL
jgi:hypothetical protein